jgi:outer membrane murein-binding lipoprotein Lpp
MRSFCLRVGQVVVSLTLLAGCASAPTETENPVSGDDTCYVTGSIVPRKDCRGRVDSASREDVERVRRAPPPAPVAPPGTPR